MPRTLQYSQIDVFAERPLSGSPLAVFLDGRELDTSEMQNLAREMSLAETSFILPPTTTEGTYHIRTFTPTQEVFTAGHAYHGTAFALAEEGLIPLREPTTTIWQESHLGTLTPVEIEVVNGRPARVAVAPETPVFGRVFGRPGSPLIAAFGQALGTTPEELTGRGYFPQVVTTRGAYLVACLDNLDLLSGIQPDYAALANIATQIDVNGFCVFSPHARELKAQIHLRVFNLEGAGSEEAAGSGGAAALGAYLANRKAIRTDNGPARFTVEQGIEMGRPSRIDVTVASDSIDLETYLVRILANCVTVATGEFYLL